MIILLSFGRFSAQVPASIHYQAVARDYAGNPLANKNLSLRFSVHSGIASGAIVYQETNTSTTNALGLFTSGIGKGIPVIATLAGVYWADGAKFLEVEIDTAGGSSFVTMGTSQLNSVPYALFAGKSTDLPVGVFSGSTMRWNGMGWITDSLLANLQYRQSKSEYF